MEPLYCFKLNEESGLITKCTIPEYEKVQVSKWTGRTEYRFKTSIWAGTKTQYICREENIDYFVNGKLYTFNPDRKRATALIRSYINQRCDKHYTEYKRWQEVLERIS